MTGPDTHTAARAATGPPAPVPTAPAGVRVGCDVVTVQRVTELLARRPGARDVLFSAVEQAEAVRDGVAHDDPVALRRLAARFAAKEATVKLLGRPRLAWTEVEVRSDADGAPALWILGSITEVAVSLSHDGDVAMAVVAVAAAARLPAFPAR
jgi:holo-[acyl-carrier protein] synthase